MLFRAASPRLDQSGDMFQLLLSATVFVWPPHCSHNATFFLASLSKNTVTAFVVRVQEVILYLFCYRIPGALQFSSVQSLSRVRLFATP